MIERTIYECEHCHRKRLMSKCSMKQHEKKCWYNPINKTCVTCKHGEMESDSCDHPELDGCPVERWTVRICNHPQRISEPTLESLEPKINCLFWEEDDFSYEGV